MPDKNTEEEAVAPMAKKISLSSTLTDPFEVPNTKPIPKGDMPPSKKPKLKADKPAKEKPEQEVKERAANKTKTSSKTNTSKTNPSNKPATNRQRRDLDAEDLNAAANSGLLKSNAEKKVRRSWGGALETIPKDLYLRGTPRTKKMFSGPTSTYAAFDEYCVINNYTKWEALEVLLRKGPDPFIVDE